MGGVYGDFIEYFQELYEPHDVWTKEDRSDTRRITAVYLPNKGDGIKRRKYTSGNTALDIQDTDVIYVSATFKNKISVGDYIQKVGDPYFMRVTNNISYIKAAGYMVFAVDRVTGPTPDKDEPLGVKEGYFA